MTISLLDPGESGPRGGAQCEFCVFSIADRSILRLRLRCYTLGIRRRNVLPVPSAPLALPPLGRLLKNMTTEKWRPLRTLVALGVNGFGPDSADGLGS